MMSVYQTIVRFSDLVKKRTGTFPKNIWDIFAALFGNSNDTPVVVLFHFSGPKAESLNNTLSQLSGERLLHETVRLYTLWIQSHIYDNHSTLPEAERIFGSLVTEKKDRRVEEPAGGFRARRQGSAAAGRVYPRRERGPDHGTDEHNRTQKLDRTPPSRRGGCPWAGRIRD